MCTRLFRISAALTLILALMALPTLAQNRLVNMVPNCRSGERNQDSEPTITVDPNNFLRMAGSAFTWDNLTEAPMVTATAPIYVSIDGGNTWTLAFMVPSRIGATFPTGDITLSFSSTLSGAQAHQTSWLYGGTLSSTTAARPMTVLRGQDPFSATLMTTLDTRTGNVDQPHTISRTSGAGQDKLYIGINNGYGCVVPSGRTSTLDVSQDAAATTPTFALDLIEARDTACQDGFAQVAAPHSDGTVYAVFIHDWSGTPGVVVVRDDNWGIGSAPFSALQNLDPIDATHPTPHLVPGRFVNDAITLASGSMGQNRLGASNLSIAVDPNDSDRVYVAWGDSNGANSETIHVRRSINRGVDWSADLLTVTSAMNPQIAINDIGVVGVLYQGVVGGKWETRLAKSNDMDATTFTTPGALLASQSSTTPAATFSPYIGDYACLVAAGTNFVGVFSASNYPDAANFMTGVKFQREVDWTTHKLYTDAAHQVEVAPSIDPFFFEIGSSLCDKSRFFCDICASHPHLCFPIYDPLWWLKCPMCGIDIFIRQGDDIRQVTVFDSQGKEVGKFQRLREPIVEKGVTYNYTIRLKLKEGVGYVLKAELAPGKKLKGNFRPAYIIKNVEAPSVVK